MATKKSNVWKITPEQVRILSNCQRVNDIILIKASAEAVISVDALDESFTMIYINEQFDYPISKEIIAHSLSEILKSAKNINEPRIVLTDDRISVTDKEGNIRCNYLYADDNLVVDIRGIYDAYNNIITGIKEDADRYVFKITDNEFNLIRKFISFGHNSLSFVNGKIIIYDNTASSDVSLKDNIEIKIPKCDSIGNDFRLDIDIALFKKMQPGNYNCSLSSQGLALFEQTDGGNIYGIVSNII